ncbi:hypothetical protein [Bradyrhizobium japonicum]|uniref:hypothetical protein n=1 Tax=Bradyrhizobium japonicum TaxID=375 RepID=UPI001BA7D20E|nr:hypothetical protein [Bradyrhizobium japonicum]MBR0910804.1 hypothetical protein [Bradyrhizobium japonicum]
MDASTTTYGDDYEVLLARCGVEHDAAAAEQQPDRTLFACGRLADAKRIFATRGWDVLPQGRRGQAILRWAADHAFLASPANPMRSVRNWSRKWAPWCIGAEFEDLLDYVKTSNKRWSHDDSAIVFGITVADRQSFRLRFFGACDDPTYEIRLGIKREKAAARARKHRAAHSAGRKGGRPALDLPPEEKRARRLAQEAARKRTARASAKTPSRDINNIRSVTELMRTRPTATYSTIRADAIDLTGIDLRLFGIVGIRVLSGSAVVALWGC